MSYNCFYEKKKNKIKVRFIDIYIFMDDFYIDCIIENNVVACYPTITVLVLYLLNSNPIRIDHL